MKDHKWHLSLRKCGAMENCNGVRVGDFDLDVRVVPPEDWSEMLNDIKEA